MRLPTLKLTTLLESFSKDRIIIGKVLKEDKSMGMFDPRNIYIKMTDKEKRYNKKLDK